MKKNQKGFNRGLNKIMKILSTIEIALAQSIIDDIAPGKYNLKELYGSHWVEVDSPTTFGGDFKETVAQGLLQCIKFVRTRSDNSAEYEVF
jgi:hypothetical protein